MSQTTIFPLAVVLAGLGIGLSFVGFGVVSLREREARAAAIAFLLAVVTPLAFAALAVSPVADGIGKWIAAAGIGLAAVAAWLLPVGSVRVGHGRPTRRVDERDIMFARARLVPGSHEFDAYYAMRPENKLGDDETRALPGLLSPEAALADPIAFASAEASEALTETLRRLVDGSPNANRSERTAQEWTALARRMALYFGARDAGIAELRPYHVYTHVGRGSGTWGEPIRLDHAWAIAFTVEMDHAVMRCAPAGPVVAESTRQYVESARVAVQLAAWIRWLGYPARAHIDGNYRVIAPLVARDAGLGELGRMGILMTPGLGPRVRLGVVTTDLPLVADSPGDDLSVLDFCTVCKKCAENCPSRSIPFGDPERIDGGYRWAIDSDGCFRYWAAIGTDCGRCMSVCPYSHPDNAAHNLVRWAIRRSGAARRAALWLDDLFYGRRPRALPPC